MANPVPFSQFSSELLSLYEPPLRAKSTQVKMRQVLRTFGAFAGEISTAELTPLLISRFIVHTSETVSNNTCCGLISYLRAACRYAVARGYLDSSPFDARRKWLRWERTARRRHHSREDLRRVLDHLASLPDTWRNRRLLTLFCVVAFTGLRRSEALGLQVADFDRDLKILWILSRAGRRLKTSDSAAFVPVPPPLFPILVRWVDQVESIWLFPGNRKTSPWSGSNGLKPGDFLRAAGEAAGVKGLTFQSLRHSWATHAESSWGLSELTVQRILRHSSSPTQLHYRHADLINLSEAMLNVNY